MKKTIKNITTFALGILFFIPFVTFANGGLLDYGSYDLYDYSSYNNYGSNDLYDYGSYNSYNSYDLYDYGSSNTYGSYDLYDYGSYNNYGSYDLYDYGSSNTYGSYDLYDYGSYSTTYTTGGDYYGGYGSNYGSYASIYQDYYPGYAYGGYSSGYTSGGCTSNCGGTTNTNTYRSLTVSCTVSDSSVEEGDSVTFTAYANGGKGKYTYSWTGAGLAGKTSKSVSNVFNSEGTYYAKVKVTDGKGNTATANCAGVHVQEERQTYNPVDVTCTVSDRTIEDGDSVTYTADADGGRGSYTYRWYGDASGSSRSVTEDYNNPGTYYAYVRVTDQDGRSATANCDSVRVEEEEDDEDFDVVCKVSDTSIEEDDTVRFTAEVDGGDGPYDYEWDGDVDEDERSFTARFTREGRYEVELKVRDDEGRIARDTCPTIRVDEEDNDDDDDRDINVTSGTLSSGNGTFAGVSSVYLNQVPYTGPEDVAKGIAFVVGILAWSIAAALIIRNRMNKKEISNRIAAFKEANKATRI